MPEVRPFHGVRFDAEQVDLGRALCPPYDVIKAAEARRLRSEKINAVRLELPAGAGAGRYGKAAGVWGSWVMRGLLRRDGRPALYAVEESFRHEGRPRRRRGFLAALGLGRESVRSVVRHERTFPAPRADRLEVLRALRVNVSPIFGVFPDRSGAVREALGRALAGRADAEARLPDGAVRYRLRRVEDAGAVAAVRSALGRARMLIADGHHRYAAGRLYRREGGPGADAVLAYLCPEEDPGLVVLPTHRVVAMRGLAEAAAARCRLTGAASLPALLGRLRASRNPYAFGLLDGGGKARLAEPRGGCGCRSGLSVEWVSARLLGAVPRELVSYTPRPGEAALAAARVRGTAVIVKPFEVPDVRRAAEAVGLLPQKSTYFFPKVATGLVFKTLYAEVP